MMIPTAVRTIPILLALAVAGTAAAKERTEVVHFKSGSTFATIKGSIKGYDVVKYALGAKAGQMIHILFSGNNGACYFNFIEAGANAAVHLGEVAGNEFSKRLERSGNSHAEVYMMRSAARRNEVCNYSITFEITGD